MDDLLRSVGFGGFNRLLEGLAVKGVQRKVIEVDLAETAIEGQGDGGRFRGIKWQRYGLGAVVGIIFKGDVVNADGHILAHAFTHYEILLLAARVDTQGNAGPKLFVYLGCYGIGEGG